MSTASGCIRAVKDPDLEADPYTRPFPTNYVSETNREGHFLFTSGMSGLLGTTSATVVESAGVAPCSSPLYPSDLALLLSFPFSDAGH